MTTTLRSVTKSISIDRTPQVVFDYVADVANWPAFGAPNVLAVSPTDDPDWWDLTTPRGAGLFRVLADAATGVVDHEFTVQGSPVVTIPGRVLPNGAGAEFMLTLLQGPAVEDARFEAVLAGADVELAALKDVLEDLVG